MTIEKQRNDHYQQFYIIDEIEERRSDELLSKNGKHFEIQ